MIPELNTWIQFSGWTFGRGLRSPNVVKTNCPHKTPTVTNHALHVFWEPRCCGDVPESVPQVRRPCLGQAGSAKKVDLSPILGPVTHKLNNEPNPISPIYVKSACNVCQFRIAQLRKHYPMVHGKGQTSYNSRKKRLGSCPSKWQSW